MIVAVLLVAVALGQPEEDVNVVNVNLGKVLSDADPSSGSGDQQSMSMEEQQRYYGMRRTACLVLSRHHSNSHKDEIEGIVSALPVEQQQKFINKMYSTAVEQCEQVIVPDEVQQLYVENPSFDPTSLFHVFSHVDYTVISKESFKLSKNQEQIVEYIRNFDQEMEVKREEQKAEEEKLMGDEKYDIKVTISLTLDLRILLEGHRRRRQGPLRSDFRRCRGRPALVRPEGAQQDREEDQEEILETREGGCCRFAPISIALLPREEERMIGCFGAMYIRVAYMR